MISIIDFDHFLKKGFIEGLSGGSSMDILLAKYGNDIWYVKETELNGLLYGVIKIGFIEFHIYNERINCISYRPDISFSKKDFKGVEMPWISKNSNLD